MQRGHGDSPCRTSIMHTQKPPAAALTADCRSRQRVCWRRYGSGCPGEELCPQFTAAMTSRDAGPRRPAWLPRELLKACGGSGVPRACCRAHAARTTEKTAVVCAHLVNPVGLPKGGPRRSRQGSPATARPTHPKRGGRAGAAGAPHGSTSDGARAPRGPDEVLKTYPALRRLRALVSWVLERRRRARARAASGRPGAGCRDPPRAGRRPIRRARRPTRPPRSRTPPRRARSWPCARARAASSPCWTASSWAP